VAFVFHSCSASQGKKRGKKPHSEAVKKGQKKIHLRQRRKKERGKKYKWLRHTKFYLFFSFLVFKSFPKYRDRLFYPFLGLQIGSNKKVFHNCQNHSKPFIYRALGLFISFSFFPLKPLSNRNHTVNYTPKLSNNFLNCRFPVLRK